jgi:cold shock CspA family protein
MEGYKTLKTNDKVTFDVVTGEKGPQAAGVMVIGSDTSSEKNA